MRLTEVSCPAQQFLQIRLVRVPRFARVNDGYLACLCGFHQLTVGAGVKVGDAGLIVLVVPEHPVVPVRAFVARGAAGSLDPRFVVRYRGGYFDFAAGFGRGNPECYGWLSGGKLRLRRRWPA